MSLYSQVLINIKYFFLFAKKTIAQDHSLYIGSQEVDTLFTELQIHEIITISTKSIYSKNDTFKGLSKSKFKKAVSLT